MKEDLLDLIAGAQSSRLNEQRAPWAVLPGLTRSKQVNLKQQQQTSLTRSKQVNLKQQQQTGLARSKQVNLKQQQQKWTH